MPDNIYDPPKSIDTFSTEIEVPVAIAKKIKNAWIAGIVSGCFTLVISIVALSTGNNSFAPFSAWNLADVVLIFGLTYGIYRKNRIAAVTMLVYFLGSKIYLFTQTGTASGIPMAVIFLILYAQGVSGTFAYHKLMNHAE